MCISTFRPEGWGDCKEAIRCLPIHLAITCTGQFDRSINIGLLTCPSVRGTGLTPMVSPSRYWGQVSILNLYTRVDWGRVGSKLGTGRIGRIEESRPGQVSSQGSPSPSILDGANQWRQVRKTSPGRPSQPMVQRWQRNRPIADLSLAFPL
jgi:hypothetical protein